MGETVGVWIGIIVLLAFTIWVLRKNQAPPPADGEPDDDPDELLWCEGCNDRHMRKWFRWVDGKLRCIVCCKDRTYARNRNRPNEGDPE